MPKIQRKLALALSILVLITVTLTGILAERGVRQRTLDRIEASLVERARLISELGAGIPYQASEMARLDDLAARAARTTQARITLIGADGRVLADSEVSLHHLASLENHADRPEVAAALSGRVGRSTRTSQTVRRELLYVAVPAATSSGVGVVRLALDPADVDAVAMELRWELVFAAIFGLVAALILSAVVSRLTLRPIEELQEVINGIAEGRLDRRLIWSSGDELGEIGLAINRVAEQMRARLDDATHEKEQLEAVLRSMVEGVLVVNAEGRVTLANPRLQELLDVWGRIEGRPWYELVREAAAVTAIRKAMDTRELVVCEFQVADLQDRTLQLHAVGFPAEGPRAGTIVVLHDVTEMRRLDNVRRDFIANASHELKTPLTAIRGFADTLLASSLPEQEVERYMNIIARNAERMSSLVDDLLTLSRIEGGTAKLQLTNVDVRDSIQVILDDLAQRLDSRGVEAVLQIEGEGMARADRRALEQILTNLLDNALKYSESGGRIDILVDHEGEFLRVSVADSGVGIPHEDLSRIFERFYRVDAARSRALGGTGLGLAIVKHLVQSMGGEVSVVSELGKGSCFRFTLLRPA